MTVNNTVYNVGSVVKWLERQNCDQHGFGSKPNHAILLCPWERYFKTFFSVWWSSQAVLNFCPICINFQADNNILGFPEAGLGNCLLYVLGLP